MSDQRILMELISYYSYGYGLADAFIQSDLQNITLRNNSKNNNENKHNEIKFIKHSHY